MSKLNFNGRAGGDFLTLPSECSTTTSYLELESWSGEIAHADTHTPVGVEGCDNVPFKPAADGYTRKLRLRTSPTAPRPK